MSVTNPMQRALLNMATNLLASAGPRLAQVDLIRQKAVGRVERWLLDGPKESRCTG